MAGKETRSKSVMWLYNGQPVTHDDLKPYEGFVYLIENLENGKRYIGKKFIFSLRKVKGKKRRQRKPSDWPTYYGSCEALKADVARLGPDKFVRTILHLCKSRGETNYREVEEQFLHRVLWDDGWYNDQIAGKWYSVNVMKYVSAL